MEINKFTFLGLLSWIGGLGIVIFQAIAKSMDKNSQWTEFFLEGIIGDALDGFVEMLPLESLQTWSDYLIYDMPLYQLLLVLGGIFIGIGMCSKN